MPARIRKANMAALIRTRSPSVSGAMLPTALAPLVRMSSGLNRFTIKGDNFPLVYSSRSPVLVASHPAPIMSRRESI